MKLFGRDLDEEIAFIAEIGVNHEGDVDVASSMLRLAAEAGADAVKLQSYTPWRYASASDPERLARVTQFALDEAAHDRLAAEAGALGVELFSTALTEDWVPLLASRFSAIKIASADLTFEPVIRAAAKTGLPMLVSTGLGTLDEIETTMSWLEDEIGRDRLAERVVLLHCVVAYPTPLEQANVAVVPALAERFHVPTGWSNHVLGPEACYAASALGAKVIEVHVTDQREGKTFHDHQLSFEPAELRDLIERCRAVRAAVGTSGKTRQPAEEALLPAVRKGLVAARDLDAGHVLAPGDVAYARPATELRAEQLDEVIGATLQQPLRRGEQLTRPLLARS